MTVRLPDGFTLGVATSAFQIEGGADHRGETIWDRFLAERGAADDGLVACDHHRRWREDVAIMAELGVPAYRFSIAWSRVLPEGTGRIDAAGIGFYDRLLDELLEHGIAPWVCLYHWDLPQALQERGGWPARDLVGIYTDYVAAVSARLGDRVDTWLTHNEPWVTSMLGHTTGEFAPGIADWRQGLAAAHHLLLSHGRAVEVLRSTSPGAAVGIAVDCRAVEPASDHERDVEAARHFDGYRNRWFFDPLFGRGYPADLLEHHVARERIDPEALVRDGDLATIATPIDVLGLNYYTRLRVAAGHEEDEASDVPPGPNPPPGHTEMGWAIAPDALRAFLGRLHADYAPARIVVSENGASYSDGPGPDGRVVDVRRIDYLRDHIAATVAAAADGVPVDGYFAWSLLDNLEWTSGFAQRFGLVWVDHATQRRIIKDSGHWFARLAATRALDDGPEDRRDR
jgi:beta-glucosidase